MEIYDIRKLILETNIGHDVGFSVDTITDLRSHLTVLNGKLPRRNQFTQDEICECLLRVVGESSKMFNVSCLQELNADAGETGQPNVRRFQAAAPVDPLTGFPIHRCLIALVDHMSDMWRSCIDAGFIPKSEKSSKRITSRHGLETGRQAREETGRRARDEPRDEDTGFSVQASKASAGTFSSTGKTFSSTGSSTVTAIPDPVCVEIADLCDIHIGGDRGHYTTTTDWSKVIRKTSQHWISAIACAKANTAPCTMSISSATSAVALDT